MKEVSMHRSIRLSLGTLALLAVTAGGAQAQYYPGYGGYGWGGWGRVGAVGATVQGNEARGLGYYDMGLGVLREDTAEAAAINEGTVKDWNEFMFLSQQEANRREYLRSQRRMRRDAASGEAFHQRLRDNPTPEDIRDGNALNVLLDQVTDPRVHSSALRTADAPIPSEVVRTIPFRNATEPVTLSLQTLTVEDGWPIALKAPIFAPERRAYQDAINQALKEDEEGDISPQTLMAVRSAVDRLQAKLTQNRPRDPQELVEAQNYVKALYGMARMLDSPQTEKILAELKDVPKTTLGSLLGFMHAYNLRFGTPTTPKQEEVYEQLYPMLSSLRDKITKDLKADETATASRNEKRRPTDFFQGMKLEHLSGNRTSAPAPDQK